MLILKIKAASEFTSDARQMYDIQPKFRLRFLLYFRQIVDPFHHLLPHPYR